MLKIKNLNVFAEEKEILKGLNLLVEKNTIHAIMGLNGSGKSTLASCIVGIPDISIKSGLITFQDIALNPLSIDQRSKMGIFLSFQNPTVIPGITVGKFLKKIFNIHRKDEKDSDFVNELLSNLERLSLKREFINRYLNDGFSGGEKKKIEMLQIMIIRPKFVILDEIDSGLDIEALSSITEMINELKQEGITFLVISHYKKLFDYINPDVISVLSNKKISIQGGREIIRKIDQEGYSWIK